MGFFSRRRDKESALSAADLAVAEAGAATVEVTREAPAPATLSTPAPPQQPEPAPSLGFGRAPAGGSIANEVEAATSDDLGLQLAGLAKLMSEHEFDLRSQPMEVREAVAADMRAGGVDSKVGQQLNITDPAQIQVVIDVLKKHGLLPANLAVNK
jgi:hypothetical protein